MKETNFNFSQDFKPNFRSLNMNFTGSVEDSANYYCKEANKLYFANLILNNQLKAVMQEKVQINRRINAIENQKKQQMEQSKKKRHRRTANQVQRSFKCPSETCQKSYGSQGSLWQHIKLKHNELYKLHYQTHGNQVYNQQTLSKKQTYKQEEKE